MKFLFCLIASLALISVSTPSLATVSPPYYFAAYCTQPSLCTPNVNTIYYGPYSSSFTQCFNAYSQISSTGGPGPGRIWKQCSQSIHWRTGVQCTVPNTRDCPTGNDPFWQGPYISQSACLVQYNYYNSTQGRALYPNPPWAAIPCQRY